LLLCSGSYRISGKMNLARQLYQLQELDLEIESDERALKQVTSQLGESQAVLEARSRLQSEQQHLEELKHQQHSAEWEIDDITTKIATAEETLFSGRVKNPKELASLQQDVKMLKDRCGRLEEKALGVIEQVEQSEAGVATINSQLETLTADWRHQQKQLSQEMEKLKAALADLKGRRQLLSAEIEPETIEFYQQLRKGKGTAVARVEQGICRGCRISLPITDLQRVRGTNLVQCSSCGRILFLA
jgi:predicted  nucleic acid-binding Zn-ribbon protein